MTKTTPTFESRLVRQSRECVDLNGTASYEHNSYLEPGEKVLGAHSDIEMTVVKSRYRNPLTRQELVTVAGTNGSDRSPPNCGKWGHETYSPSFAAMSSTISTPS